MYNYRNQHESSLATKAKEGIKILILSSIELIKVIVWFLTQIAGLSIVIQYLWNHCLVSSFSVLPTLSFINVFAALIIIKLIKEYT
jgi:hypothetical protein